MPRYMINIDDREYDIHVEYRQAGFEVTLGDKHMTVNANDLGGSRSILLIDNCAHEVDVRSSGYSARRTVFMHGVEIPVEIEEYNLARLRKTVGMAAAGTAMADVKAPMPGLVLEVKVEPGQEVKKGEALVVIEAMKMENIIKAVSDAKVSRVAVEKGASVEKNDLLIEFE
jgi:acetyl/propionyl-CoA carboxylase alpha subunit